MSEPPSFQLIGATELFRPLPPIVWAVEPLGLTAGATNAVAGYGFGGKSMLCQSIAVAKTTGRPLWDRFDIGRGSVVHFDYEQGFRLTAERYQRLARGAGIAPDEFGDRLKVAVLPQIYLDSPDAVDAYARALDGHSLAIVDSLRAAAPTADENSSEIRQFLDALSRASEKSGCCTLFIHHARKPADGQKGGAKTSLRGSSAIFDACASVYVLAADKGEPTTVHHEKDRARGILLDDFQLRIEDVPINGEARAGLRIVYSDPSTVAGERDQKQWIAEEQLLTRIRTHLAQRPDDTITSIREALGKRKTDVITLLKRLMGRGEVINTGTEGRPLYRLAQSTIQ